MSVMFAWLINHTAGSLVAALLMHTAVNFWPSVVPVWPTATSQRAYAFVVASLVVPAIAALFVSGPKARRTMSAVPESVAETP